MFSDFPLLPQHATSISIMLSIAFITGCGGNKVPQDTGGTNVPGKEAVIEGTANYRERILLPASSVFEAYLQDVSIADAPATEIARTSLSDIRTAPISFSIAYDPARIDERKTYSVRARILIDGELWFTSDTAQPVLTHGAGRKVDILLKMVKGNAPDSSGMGSAAGGSPGAGALGLHLPATFRGDLPCADCQAIRYHLDLWPDNVYHLRREWQGKNLVKDRIGQWLVDPASNALTLYEVNGEEPLKFEVTASDKLKLLNIKSAPIESSLPHELTSDGALAETDLSLALGGEMTYIADAARFAECLTGRSYPIAMEGDFEKLQQAYLKNVKEPGAPLYVTFEGSITDRPKMEGAGVERSVVVRRFIHAWPNQKCAQSRANASLSNTYWRINSIRGKPVFVESGQREPHLLLRYMNESQTYAATVGCNQLIGSYALDGENIEFNRGQMTLIACPPPLDALEKNLADVLAKTKRWLITGNTLEFRDGTGSQIALFEAVYL